jgi:hypothetical protein
MLDLSDGRMNIDVGRAGSALPTGKVGW